MASRYLLNTGIPPPLWYLDLDATLLTAMYQGPNVVACVGEFPVLFACATDPDRLVAAVADGQRAGKLPRVVTQ
ncbi:MAG TPA: hypothetical protein VNW94_21980 [Streptosporangiaceae bacterium]|nr:hypothetical protein [Streptosporangiaceae bacterium]